MCRYFVTRSQEADDEGWGVIRIIMRPDDDGDRMEAAPGAAAAATRDACEGTQREGEVSGEEERGRADPPYPNLADNRPTETIKFQSLSHSKHIHHHY